MKVHIFHLWHLGIVLLAAVSIFALMQARAQTAPQPVPPPVPAEPQPGVTPPANPAVPDPAALPPPARPSTSQVAPTAVSGGASKGAATGAVANPFRSASTSAIINTVPTSAYYAEKMHRTILPEVRFKDASLEEAIEFLRVKSREYDGYERDPAKKGVNFILKPDAAASTAKINLDLNEVPMAEALKYITELAGMKYKIEAYAVVVMSLSEWNTGLDTRAFKVPPGVAGQTAVDILKEPGVLSSEGASATFVPATSLLIVRGTLPELDQAEMMLEEWIKRATPMRRAAAAAPAADDRADDLSIISAPGMAQAAPPTWPAAAPAPAATPTRIIEMHGGMLREVAPGGSLLFVADEAQAGGGTSIASRLETSARAQQLLRDTELKVLLRHFETTVAEIADGEKALVVDSDAAKRAALEANLEALNRWKSRLVTGINELTGTAATPAAGAAQQRVPIWDIHGTKISAAMRDQLAKEAAARRLMKQMQDVERAAAERARAEADPLGRGDLDLNKAPDLPVDLELKEYPRGAGAPSLPDRIAPRR